MRSHARAHPSRSAAPAARPRGDEVGELGVAVGVRVEVAAQPVEEHLVAEVQRQLAKHGRALRVGDAVELGQRARRVRRRRCRPPGASTGGGRPRSPTTCGGCRSRPTLRSPVDPLPEVLGEGLVEPQVVPPAHRDEIAEPHVRHLVRDRDVALEAVGLGDPRAEHQRVAERDAARVLHRAGVELRHERLVVLAPRVADAEQPVQFVEAVLGVREQLLGARGRGVRPATAGPAGPAGCRRARRARRGTGRRRAW